MSEKNLIYKNKRYKKKIISISDKINLDVFSKIIYSKLLIYMTNKNEYNPINIKPLSIKRILLNGQLKPNEFILFFLYKESLKKSKSKNSIKEKDYNEEITEDEDEDVAAIKKDEDEAEQKNKTNSINKENLNVVIKNKNENIFNPEFPLLHNKITNTYSNIENLPIKYINLIIFYNKITISVDYLKCFYLILFFCGISNLIYFLIILSNFNFNFLGFNNLYQIFYAPLGFLLIATGIFGYKKINENIYNDKACLILTQLSFISPMCSFALSRFSSEDNIKRNVMIDIIINLLSSFISFICIIILKEVKRVQNSEKNILEV